VAPSDVSRVIIGHGPRAVELALLDEVDRLRPRTPEELGLPVRVIVPSRSLRLHLIRRLVTGCGAPIVGVTVQTLTTASREVLDRAGERWIVGDALFEVLVRRLVRDEQVLARELDGLDDGYGVAVGAVRDLLDAGFGPAHLEALDDKLASLEGVVSHRRLERVAALARIAVEVGAELSCHGVCRLQQVPQRATDLLRERGPAALPSRAVLVHGFADATGVVSDFLEAMLAVLGGAALLDRPLDPAAPETVDAGAAFLERIEGRFGGLERRQADGEPLLSHLGVFHRAEAEGEVREAARRIRALIDRGVRPESIGVVARGLEPVATAIRRQFDRLGIPYSGAGAEVPGGEEWRRARQLARLLRSGVELPAEQWIESLCELRATGDLQLALRTLGVVRVADVAALRVTRHIQLPLPAVGEDEEPPSPRQLAANTLEEAVAGARLLERRLASWPASDTATGHLHQAQMVQEALGWSLDDELLEPVRETLLRLTGEFPASWQLGRNEWTEAAARRLEQAGGAAIGGAGRGVQVLSALEARARTFEHLFVLCLNRGVFPRIVQDDPLLPDSVRGHLAVELLAEFPVKARGLDEERYLFAQLATAAPAVTLSWADVVNGSKAAPSPFVERLQRERTVIEAPIEEASANTPVPAFEHALAVADPTTRDRLAPVLAEARSEGRLRAGLGPTGDAGWPQARIAILEAIDPARGAPDPGPWSGLVGPGVWPEGPPAVTRIEELARCPWQAFAVRRLGLAPMPDPRHGLPDPGPAVVGQLVHRVLQRIVDEAVGRGETSLEEVRSLDPLPVPWPDHDRLNQVLLHESERIASAAGISGYGIAPLLAAQARPYLETARAVEWGEDGRLGSVLAAEVSGELCIDGVEGGLRFRADRADRIGDRLELVDYKIAKPPSIAKGEDTRHRKHLERIATGRALQAVAYAGAGGGASVGRYLYLRPDLNGPEEARSVAVDASDGDAVASFSDAVAAVLAAVETGALFPRVEEPDGSESRFCDWCPVRQACLRDDSGYRDRLVAWMGARDRRRARPVIAARRLWWLGFERSEGAS
jgi:RecB family exonuclease